MALSLSGQEPHPQLGRWQQWEETFPEQHLPPWLSGVGGREALPSCTELKSFPRPHPHPRRQFQSIPLQPLLLEKESQKIS